MRFNAEHLIEKFGVERVVMGTFTTRAHLTFDAFQCIWNSFVTNVLRPRLGIVGDDWKDHLHGMSVIEPQERGAPHAHLLVATKDDVGTGLRWLRKGKRYVVMEWSKNASLTALQAYLMEKWDAYVRVATKETGKNVSNAHCLPIRKSAASAAYYLAEYLKKGQGVRPHEWKGRRLYREYGGEHPCVGNFTLYARKEENNYVVYDLGIVRRARIAEFARRYGCHSLDGLCRILGGDVLYKYSKEINETLLPGSYVFPSKRTAEWEADNRYNSDPDVILERSEAKMRIAKRKAFEAMSKDYPWTGDQRIHTDDVFRPGEIAKGKALGREAENCKLRTFRAWQGFGENSDSA